MMRLILDCYDLSLKALDSGIHIDKLAALPVREKIGRFKYIEESRISQEYEAISLQLQKEIAGLQKEEE